MMAKRRQAFWKSWWLAVAVLAGCNAGAWPAIHRTPRGLETRLTSTLDEVEAYARTALAEWDLEITRSAAQSDGARRMLEGYVSGLRVVVEIDRETPTTTRTEVIAWSSTVKWDRTVARAILDRIVLFGGPAAVPSSAVATSASWPAGSPYAPR
jgi:hypothetical protein